MFKTEICDLLDIEYPILQGGMAWVATGELAGAVSQAGGLGIIGAGNAPPDIVKEEIAKVRRLTKRPFGVNIYFLSPFAEEIIDLVIEEKIPVVTTGAGNPGKYIDRFHSAGIKVIPVISSVVLARRLERAGVDAVIVEGMECGGHIGRQTTMVLVPQVRDAVDIPVIAAGGIADGRTFFAALVLGASGVQMGTRFVCARECIVHDNYKEAILAAGDRDTMVTGRSLGHPVRVLRNKFARNFQKKEENGAQPSELEEMGTGRLQRAAQEGDIEYGSVMVGQIAGLIDEVLPVEEIITGILREARELTGLWGEKN